jgi:hypothetical protein
MRIIKVTASEAMLLGNVYKREFCEDDIPPERMEVFLEIKNKKLKNRR